MNNYHDPKNMSTDAIRAEIHELEKADAPVEEQFFYENRFEELCQELHNRNEVL